MAAQNSRGGSKRDATSQTQGDGGTAKPEPKDTQGDGNAAPADGVAPAAQVEQQREAEAKEQAKVAAEAGTGGAASPSEKGQQTRAAADVVEQAKADAEARAATVEEQRSEALATPGGDDPVSRQRREEAEAAAAAKAEAEGTLSEKDKRLLAAAPGGARTALAGGKEGSTVVTHTAANPRPASGPLDAPVTGIENYAATEDDPDNRVYADEAGPRLGDDLVEPERRFVDEAGNDLAYDAIFEDDPSKTFVTAKARVYETFVFPNTETEGRRLAYVPGKRVPRGEADNVRLLLGGGE